MKPFQILIIIVVLSLVGTGAWFLLGHRPEAPSQKGYNPYQKVESKIRLNPAQVLEVLEPSLRDSVLVYRFLDSNALWQIGSVQGASLQGDLSSVLPSSGESMWIGKLWVRPKPPEITVPLYLCRYTVDGHQDLALDVRTDCTVDGKLEKNNPIGYGSAQIRTGYYLAFRCISHKHGTYLSLNPNCEDPADHVTGTLPALRAVESGAQ